MVPALLFIIFLLICGLVGVIIVWGRANTLLAKYDAIDNTELFRQECERKAQKLQATANELTAQIEQEKQKLQKYTQATGTFKSLAEARDHFSQLQNQISTAQKQLAAVVAEGNLQEVGIYRRRYDFDSPAEYTQKLESILAQQKAMVANETACTCSIEWQVEGSVEKGRKMVKEQTRLMLRAFNGECDAAIAKVRYDNVNTVEKRIEKCFSDLNKLGATKQCELSETYKALRLSELHLTYEREVVKQEEREREREQRAELREEQKAEREIAEAKKKAEKDEAAKEKALAEARKQLAAEHGQHNAKLEELIRKLESELHEAIDRKAKAIARAQLTRSGYVYVLSNVGTMGDSVFKIGMTRRLEPLERVKELGDASVPFPFDVHAMIFCEDAPRLEAALHNRFADRRVNLVNLRREYFVVTLEEIQQAVAELFGPVTFRTKPEAEQYRETLVMRSQGVTVTTQVQPDFEGDEELEDASLLEEAV